MGAIRLANEEHVHIPSLILYDQFTMQPANPTKNCPLWTKVTNIPCDKNFSILHRPVWKAHDK